MNELKRVLRKPPVLAGLPKMLFLGVVVLVVASCQKAPAPQPQAGETSAASSPMVPANSEPPLAAADQPSSVSIPPAPAEVPPPAQPSAPVPAPQAAPPAPPPVVVPAGSQIAIRLDTTLSSKTSQVGEQFSATLAKIVRVKGVEVFGTQAPVVGKIVDAKAAGKFAGASSLGLRLVSVSDHSVVSNLYSQQVKGKGERTAVVIGGTALAGALLGGLAGHGRGALIGGAAGGGIGTLGAAETGNDRDIVLPAGSVLTFRLTKALTLVSTSTP